MKLTSIRPGAAAAALVAMLALAVPTSGQSPTPAPSEAAPPNASVAPAASTEPSGCTPSEPAPSDDAASSEPASSSAPASLPAASAAPPEAGCEAAFDPALVTAYTALYQDYVADATPIVNDINAARSWAQHKRAWTRFAKVQEPYVDAIVALPWPEDLTEVVGKWETLQRERSTLIDKMIRVRDNKALRRLSRQDEALSERLTPLAAEIRARLGVE